MLSFALLTQARKKKRIRAIKNANRQRGYDNERNTKQTGWQQFNKKFSKKRPKGSMSAAFKKKGSIFKSPATVDGKVGVTGSGGGTTEFEVRKKYKLNIGGS